MCLLQVGREKKTERGFGVDRDGLSGISKATLGWVELILVGVDFDGD